MVRASAESAETNETAKLSAADAIAAAKAAKKAPVVSTEVDDRGFARVFDKKKLVGKSFTIIDWEELYEPMSDYYYAHVRIVLGDKALFFTDASRTKGVYPQVRDLSAAGKLEMSFWPKGLAMSEYQNPSGEGMSRTFFLDDSSI